MWGLPLFGYDRENTEPTLERLLKRYDRGKRAIQVDFRRLVPGLNSPERATHLLHPYPAKLLTHIPFFFLANQVFSREGDVVADPFCGSGTVLLEAQLAGRTAVGADANPFARLLARVKTSPISASRLERSVARLFERIPDRASTPPPDVVNLERWFYPHVIRQLQRISEAIASTRSPDIRDFFRICLSNCVRRVSLADPRLSVPVRLKEGQYPDNHPLRDKTDSHLRRLRRVNVIEIFQSVVDANCERMARLVALPRPLPAVSVHSSDARTLTDESAANNGQRQTQFQLVITSPPYPGAQKYIRSCSLSLGWLELCRADELLAFKHMTIGREEFRQRDTQELVPTGVASADRILRDIHRRNAVRATIAGTYICEMRQALEEMWRHLHPGGYVVLIAANNQIAGREFRTQQYLRCIAEDIGFTTILRLIDNIRSRGLMTKRNKTASVITREWVLVFRKGHTE